MIELCRHLIRNDAFYNSSQAFSYALLTDITSSLSLQLDKLSDIVKGENISGLMDVCLVECEQQDHMSRSLKERRGLVKDEVSKLPTYSLGFCH